MKLCRWCRSPTADGKTFCNKHVLMSAAYSKRMREKRKSLGLCIRCGMNKGRSKRLSCTDCSRKAVERATKLSDLRRSLGMCVWSGCAQNSDPNHRYCGAHLKHMRDRVKKMRHDRIASGICEYCQTKARPGYVTCEKHA